MGGQGASRRGQSRPMGRLRRAHLVSLAIGGGDHFTQVIQKHGISAMQAAALAEVLELHAVSTVYDEEPGLPAGFVGRVRALEVAA